MNIIARRLKAAREEMGLSQRDLANRLGLSHVGYGDFERGKTMPSIDYLMEVSRITGRPLFYFLDDDPGDSNVVDDILATVKALPEERQERTLEYVRFQLQQEQTENQKKKNEVGPGRSASRAIEVDRADG